MSIIVFAIIITRKTTAPNSIIRPDNNYFCGAQNTGNALHRIRIKSNAGRWRDGAGDKVPGGQHRTLLLFVMIVSLAI